VLKLEPGHYHEQLICSLHHISFPSKTSIRPSKTSIRVPNDLKAFLVGSKPQRLLKSHNFDAVSYAWGSELKPCVLFCCRIEGASGQQIEIVPPRAIQITANLDSILRSLRKKFPHDELPLNWQRGIAVAHQPVPEHLWIDAVCIDQANPEERTSQVLLMGYIYSRATRTFVCLGDDSNDAAEALQCVSILQHSYGALHSTQTLQNSLVEVGNRPWLLKWNQAGFIAERLWCSFERILSSPWFSRVWVFSRSCPLLNYPCLV
jgi:hypothetical protein